MMDARRQMAMRLLGAAQPQAQPMQFQPATMPQAPQTMAPMNQPATAPRPPMQPQNFQQMQQSGIDQRRALQRSLYGR